MEILVYLYFFAIGVLTIYGMHRSVFVMEVLKRPFVSPKAPSPKEWPRVCVQLPLYNERHVARRVIEAVGALDYPADKLEIQILDDSTDETGVIVDDAARDLVSAGLAVAVLRRTVRTDYKAGALREGVTATKAEFLAVFDADFVPSKDFLKCTVPHFVSKENVAFVQTRWGHLNRTTNLLTRAQAVLLDGHFVLEHTVRARVAFFNFNGTAGVWRKQAILSAGGWQGDTLTEDLDLSYRSFLDGWQAVYLRDTVCFAELPESIVAFKSQQYRWMKGAAQVFRKLILRILLGPVSFRAKVEAFFHLSAHFCYVLLVFSLFLLLPASLYRAQVSHIVGSWFEVVVFLFTLFSLTIFYCVSQLQQGRRINVVDVLAAISLGLGIGAHCAVASLSGLSRNVGEFVRTPKSGDTGEIAALGRKEVSPHTRFKAALGELSSHKKEVVIASYLLAGMIYLAVSDQLRALPFMCLLLSGYVLVLSSAVRSSDAGEL